MSVGLLIVTHERLAAVMVDTAVHLLAGCPLRVTVMPVSGNCDPDRLRQDAREKIEDLDDGDGVLVLTDMYGSTPSNVAQSLLAGKRVAMVAGINLPMLVRVLNYPDLTLEELTEKAVSGGRDGVFACPVDDNA